MTDFGFNCLVLVRFGTISLIFQNYGSHGAWPQDDVLVNIKERSDGSDIKMTALVLNQSATQSHRRLGCAVLGSRRPATGESNDSGVVIADRPGSPLLLGGPSLCGARVVPPRGVWDRPCECGGSRLRSGGWPTRGDRLGPMAGGAIPSRWECVPSLGRSERTLPRTYHPLARAARWPEHNCS